MKRCKPRAKAKSGPINLYWVTTEDHDEDWFILAKTNRAAENYHIEYEGYETGDAQAELILLAGEDSIPSPIPRHAQLKDLQKLGFEILNADPNGRSVRRSGRTFVEGHLESMVAGARDDMHEETGKGRPWGTSRRSEN